MISYPKERRENMEWRVNILCRCKEDPKYLASVKELYYRDPLFAFNAFFYTFDVRKKPQCIPFMTWEFQDEFILDLVDAIKSNGDRVINKSRDMGATWVLLGTLYRL